MRPETLRLQKPRGLRIALDLRCVATGVTELERNAMTLLISAERAAKGVDIVPIASEVGAALLAASGASTSVVRWRGESLPDLLANQEADALHAPHVALPRVRVGTYVSTIHDDTPLARPDLSTGAELEFFHANIDRAVRNAAQIVVLSESSRRVVEEHLGLAADRVRVIPPAVHPIFRPEVGDADRTTLARLGLSPGFLLSTSASPRTRNVKAVAEAYAELCRHDADLPPLVMAGDGREENGDVIRSIDRLKLGTSVRLVDAASISTLACLYRSASVFILPSLHECSALPALEAMASGTPVIAFDSPCLREIGRDAIRLVDAQQPSALDAAIGHLIEDELLRASLASRGLARASEFSLERQCRELLSCHQSALAEA